MLLQYISKMYSKALIVINLGQYIYIYVELLSCNFVDQISVLVNYSQSGECRYFDGINDLIVRQTNIINNLNIVM